MKNITKLSIALGFFLMISNSSFSQQPQRGQQRTPPSAEQRIERATKELNLTTAQVKQWNELHEKYGEFEEGNQLSRKERAALSKELEATLNEDQLEKFQEMRKNRRPPKPGN